MKYPKETLTITREGKTEVRHLVDKGEYSRSTSPGRRTLLLKGKETRSFLIRPSGRRFLFIESGIKPEEEREGPGRKGERGSFVIYEYLDPETGKPASNKRKLVLLSAEGKDRKREEFFLIPLSTGRLLAIPTASKGPAGIWTREKVVVF